MKLYVRGWCACLALGLSALVVGGIGVVFGTTKGSATAPATQGKGGKLLLDGTYYAGRPSRIQTSKGVPFLRTEVNGYWLTRIPHFPAKDVVTATDTQTIQEAGARYLPHYAKGRGCDYLVVDLEGKDLTPEVLKPLDAVVIGVRAFNTRTDLAGNVQSLFEYANNGGTVIEQYNRPEGLQNATLAPYPLRLTTQRVTDENAKVTFLVPESPALNVPNKITEVDFANWVQERNIYLPDQWDAKFTPILGMADPGETPPNSSLLVAQHGKGYFVYTSLVFFRELPAGNPGAYRLFANLLSLGK